MRSFIFVSAAALLMSCARTERPPVEDLSSARDVSGYRLSELRGTRDGADLEVAATFSGSGAPIDVRMRFAIGSPTTLTSGRWTSGSDSGSVASRSITFLGGQNSSPSIGGSFDLLATDGAARYRIRIPTTELQRKL